MSRRSPRVRVRFAATVEIAGVEHTLVCHTRDISNEGCFLDTAELIAEGVHLSLAVMDAERGEVVEVNGRVARAVDGEHRGIGVRLIAPPDAWLGMVERYREGTSTEARPSTRLRVLVLGDQASRRGALALYVTSGWDVRFASDVEGALEALRGFPLDAVIAERDLDDDSWPPVLNAVRTERPTARRIVRCRLSGAVPRSAGEGEGGRGGLVHRFVEADDGIDALLDAVTSTPVSRPPES